MRKLAAAGLCPAAVVLMYEDLLVAGKVYTILKFGLPLVIIIINRAFSA